MTPDFVAAVCALIDAVLIEHCIPPDGNDAPYNEAVTVDAAIALVKVIRATPEFSALHAWADKRLLADHTDPDEILKVLVETHQWVERHLKQGDADGPA